MITTLLILLAAILIFFRTMPRIPEDHHYGFPFPKHGLSELQKLSNAALDLEIENARRYNERMDEQDRIAREKYAQYLEANPNTLMKSCPGLSVYRKHVHGIRYVE